ncbi:MAG TPA: hypothetical protein VFG89_08905 [Coriobacteriia bacterium]|nr:hypothetical protein [Coriobacteriia bacterium]
MFDEARRDTSDQLSMTMGELEEWLDDNEYPVTSVTLAGELPLAQPGGLALSGDNDAITIGFLAAEGAEPDWRSYLLEELWSMNETELRSELDDLMTSPEVEEEE